MKTSPPCSCLMLLGAVALSIFPLTAAASRTSWKVADATRTIKLGSNLGTAVHEITLQNVGREAADSFLVSWSRSLPYRVAHVTATGRGGRAGKRDSSSADGGVGGAPLDVVMHAREPANGEQPEGEKGFATVFLPASVQPGGTADVTYSLHLGLPYTPLPKQLDTLFQEQWLVFEDQLRVDSVYEVEREKTVLELPEEKPDPLAARLGGGVVGGGEPHVESWSPMEHGKRTGKKITFGPFGAVAAGAEESEKLRVHFSHQSHQAYFEQVRREIEVSHWGNVAFKEDYKLKHGGAEMAGSFNRITFTWSDYRQRGMSTPPNPILTGMDELSVVLPKTARNLHYRDDIGNISSSNARRDDRGYVLAQIRPRYPLLGGWKADWSFSYDVPTRSALKVDPLDPSLHVLNITLSPPVVRTFSEKLYVEVLLPEGAHDIQLLLPKLLSEFQDKQGDGTVYNTTKNSWLDFAGGRMVVGFELDDFFVPEKSILQYKFQVIYRFDTTRLLCEPILLSSVLFLCFLTYISWRRLELRIVRKGEAEMLNKAEFEASLIRRAMDEWDALTSEFDNTLTRADLNAKIPQRQKWDPFLTSQKDKHAKLAEKLDETLAASREAALEAKGDSNSISKQARMLEKARSSLKQYLEHQEKHIELRSANMLGDDLGMFLGASGAAGGGGAGGRGSAKSRNSGSSSGSGTSAGAAAAASSGGNDLQATIMARQRCAELETGMSLQLRALHEEDMQDEIAWTQPVL